MCRLLSFRLIFVLLLWSAVVSPLWARYEFVTTVDGRRVAGSEVCFYRSNAVENPIDDLTVTLVRCYPADLLLDIPPGAFTIMARNLQRGLVAQTPGFAGSRTPSTEDELASSNIPMVPAAFLDVGEDVRRLGSDEHFVLLFGATARTRPYLHPVSASDATVLIPPDTPFVVIRVRGIEPVAVSDVATARAGAHAGLPPFPRDIRFLVTAAQIVQPGEFKSKPECLTFFSNEFARWMTNIPRPTLRVVSSGRPDLSPLFEVKHPGQWNAAPVVFRGLSPGDAEIRFAGERWTAATSRVTISPERQVVTVRTPLRTTPASLVRVAWDIPAEFTGSRTSCEEETAPKTRTLLLLRCPGLSATSDPLSIPDDACSQAGAASLPAEHRGVTTFERIPAGTYVARLRYEALPPAQTIVHPSLGDVADVSVSARPDGIWGRVVRLGKPIRAQVLFSSGSAVSDPDTGEYYALSASPPGRRLVRIRACDGSFVHSVIPDTPIEPNTRFDIEVPVNDVRARIEGESGRIGAGVTVSLSVADPRRPGAAAYSMTGVTNEEGTAELGPVTRGSHVRICAGAEGYTATCSEPVKITEEHTNIGLRLRRAAGTGRAPAGYERIFWTLPNGVVTEDAVIDPETGEFTFRQPHAAPEAVVLVGREVPLLVHAVPAPSESRMEIAASVAPRRNFAVTVTDDSAQESALLTIRVGSVQLPLNAFLAHQQLRGAPGFVARRAAVPVRDIAAAEPITLVVGPDPFSPPTQLPKGTDPFTVPELRASFREVLVTGDLVSLPR